MFNQNINCTLKDFSHFFIEAAEDYPQLKNKSAQSVQNDYQLLKEFNIDQIYLAYNSHRQNPDSGMYPPTPAHLMKYFKAQSFSPDEIIAAARLKQTPLGILAAIHIGQGDLEGQNEFYLRQRAHEVLQLLPLWQNKFNQNKISANTLATFKKYGVSIDSHFQKIGEPKSCEVIKLEDHAKPPARISAITDLTNSKRANAQVLEFKS